MDGDWAEGESGLPDAEDAKVTQKTQKTAKNSGVVNQIRSILKQCIALICF
jgi:hypothetical protein